MPGFLGELGRSMGQLLRWKSLEEGLGSSSWGGEGRVETSFRTWYIEACEIRKGSS